MWLVQNKPTIVEHFNDVIVNLLSGWGMSPGADDGVAPDSGSDMTLWEFTDLGLPSIYGEFQIWWSGSKSCIYIYI